MKIEYIVYKKPILGEMRFNRNHESAKISNFEAAKSGDPSSTYLPFKDKVKQNDPKRDAQGCVPSHLLSPNESQSVSRVIANST